MLVAGSIDRALGIFIVSAIIARRSVPGWLLVVWIVTGLLDADGALVVRRAGGNDAESRRSIRLPARSVFSALGFLYGWTLFSLFRPAPLPAVAVGFARSWLLVPWVSETIISSPAPPRWVRGYRFPQHSCRLVADRFLTFTNTRGLEVGKLIKMYLHSKTGALIGADCVGIIVGSDLAQAPKLRFLDDTWKFAGGGRGSDPAAAFGLFSEFGGQTNYLFSADARTTYIYSGRGGQPAPQRPLVAAFGTFL